MLGLLLKTLFLVTFGVLIRSALPRYRIDQILVQNWRYFIFILIIYYLFLTLMFILFLS